MTRGCAALILLSLPLLAKSPFAGRWDITITPPTGAPYPGWIELTESAGSQPQVRVQPRSGSVRPVTDFKLDGSSLLLKMGAQGPTWELIVDGDNLTGIVKRADAAPGKITGLRAPGLDRNPPESWTKPEPLFNGRDLTGWEPVTPTPPSHWTAKDGVLLNESKGANLRSIRKFDDFKLHIEFNCPDDGNSGIYLRGRYEVQVEYVPNEDAFHRMGAVYGMVPVAVDSPRTPGRWESFDIALIGRRVTIVRNGVTVIDNQEIAGITGGALDSNEAEPGPFYFQGDHTGGMMYRNITVSVPK